tara:strand:+ start:78 stop:773 length:696 start_codon:yes stop_codon:yes gene_type:complete
MSSVNRVINASNLKIGYSKNTVLALVEELEIQQGEIVSIIGESGIGKTTLLKTIANLIKPIEGTLETFEEEVITVRGRVGFIPQKLGLIKHETVFANVMEGAICNESIWRSIIGFHEQRTIDTVQETIEQMNLSDKINESVKRLSGGQQRRVAIARTIAQKPRLILADEFLSELDDNTADNVWKTMLDYVKANSITLVIVEHNVNRAKAAQRCFSMEKQQSSEQAILTEVK